MRKNNVKKAIKKVSKKAVKNPNVAVATTAVVAGFGVFGLVEAGIIVTNKTKAKINEIKTKKEEEKKKEKTETTEEKDNKEEKNNENNEEAAA